MFSDNDVMACKLLIGQFTKFKFSGGTSVDLT